MRSVLPSLDIRSLFLFFIVLCSGCSTFQHNTPDAMFGYSDFRKPAITENIQSCYKTYAELDQAILSAKVHDAQYHRIKGFPFLKTSRFLSAQLKKMEQQSFDSEAWSEASRAWLASANELAIKSLIVEQKSLPSKHPSITQRSLLHSCGKQLTHFLHKNSHRSWPKKLVKKAPVPDHYQALKRILGLYPILSIPFKQGVKKEHVTTKERELAFNPAEKKLTTYKFENIYATPKSTQNPNRHQPTIHLNAAGIPMLNKQLTQRLINHHLPIIHLEEGEKPYNKIGRISLKHDAPYVHQESATLYYWIDYGMFQDEPTIRINYSFWFSERPKQKSYDLLSGHLDGLIWRVHTTLDGKVLAWDSIHNCGCWYRIHPAEGFYIENEKEKFFEEPIYVGKALPKNHTLHLFLQTETHHIQGIYPNQDAALPEKLNIASHYTGTLAPYHSLKILPTLSTSTNSASMLSESTSETQYKSLFNSKGITPSTQRLERFLFWPMGVRSAGAMRVAGTHAIAFIGKRHFDDPFLLDDIGLTARDPVE